MEGDEKKQRGLLRAIFLALISAMLVKAFLVDLMVTQGRSMLPTLQPGSVLVVNKAAYGVRLPVLGIYILRWSVPRSGDMVVFYTPLGERAVKRCYDVREGNFFALGDNGLESFDSRSYGPISLDHILGKVVAIK
ncbi:MAG: signal peptidase I [Spirochaetaceae bacterium]|jgi:signal peptidase I|nr:signal peptidase I [Spirochaetaceae bacterium]